MILLQYTKLTIRQKCVTIRYNMRHRGEFAPEHTPTKIYPQLLGRHVKFDAIIPTGGGTYRTVGDGDRYVLAPGIGFREGKIIPAIPNAPPMMVEITLLGKDKGYKATPMIYGRTQPPALDEKNSITFTPEGTQPLQLFGGAMMDAS